MTAANQTTVDNWVDKARAVETGEAESGSVVVALTGPRSVTSPGPDEPQGEPYQKQHAKVVRFEVSIGADDDERLLSEFIDAIRDALKAAPVNANHATYQGGYYIIDGKVCLEQDYDPATKNRKPGTFPPQWAGGPDPKKNQPYQPEPVTDDTDDDGKRGWVRVESTQPRRDPITGLKPRKPRSDKGMKKGARKTADDKVNATEAIKRMRAEGLNQ